MNTAVEMGRGEKIKALLGCRLACIQATKQNCARAVQPLFAKHIFMLGGCFHFRIMQSLNYLCTLRIHVTPFSDLQIYCASVCVFPSSRLSAPLFSHCMVGDPIHMTHMNMWHTVTHTSVINNQQQNSHTAYRPYR